MTEWEDLAISEVFKAPHSLRYPEGVPLPTATQQCGCIVQQPHCSTEGVPSPTAP